MQHPTAEREFPPEFPFDSPEPDWSAGRDATGSAGHAPPPLHEAPPPEMEEAQAAPAAPPVATPYDPPPQDSGLERRLRPPGSSEALGISTQVLEDIVLRQIVSDLRTATTVVARKLHLSVSVVDSVVQSMRDRNLVEYQGMDGRAYVVTPTDVGRNHIAQRSSECRYVGPVPVSLGLYHEVVRAQHPELCLDRALLETTFGDLVIGPDLLDELGPAIHGDGAMFLYGPPGTGKSSVAERIVRAHSDYVLIPYCLEAEGQIIAVYDPTLHEPIAQQPDGLDPRWVACLRPAVIAGGELHPGMLDLQFESDSGVYLAPLQLKANNGVFVIDDFGRQSATPEELLNRWIVPLDRGIDYLTLLGRKFEVPFDLKVVLSTNMQPAKLGDDAFFRRIHSKVFVGACSDAEFDEILRRVTEAKGIAVAPGTAEHLRHFARTQGDGELRAYLPGTVCKLALSVSSYLGAEPVLTPETIDRVMALYFTRDF